MAAAAGKRCFSFFLNNSVNIGPIDSEFFSPVGPCQDLSYGTLIRALTLQAAELQANLHL